MYVRTVISLITLKGSGLAILTLTFMSKSTSNDYINANIVNMPALPTLTLTQESEVLGVKHKHVIIFNQSSAHFRNQQWMKHWWNM